MNPSPNDDDLLKLLLTLTPDAFTTVEFIVVGENDISWYDCSILRLPVFE